MTKKRSFSAILLLILLPALGTFFAFYADAGTICEVARGIKFENGLALPPILGYRPDAEMSDFFVYFFLLAAGVAGFLALVMMVVAGIQYTTSGANPGAKKEAEERIQNALAGLALILCSYIILSIINQSLVIFSEPDISSSLTLNTTALCPSTRNARFNPDPCVLKANDLNVGNVPFGEAGVELACATNVTVCTSGQDCQIEKSYRTESGGGTTTLYDVYCCSR